MLLLDEDASVTFRVFARFDEATKERLIPIRVTWNMEGGQIAVEDLREWATYGTSQRAVGISRPHARPPRWLGR
jgi:hypothetical protein